MTDTRGRVVEYRKAKIPAPGDYRLDITADEEGNPFVYAYNIEETEKPE